MDLVIGMLVELVYAEPGHEPARGEDLDEILAIRCGCL